VIVAGSGIAEVPDAIQAISLGVRHLFSTSKFPEYLFDDMIVVKLSIFI
jgi:hypothetical protein